MSRAARRAFPVVVFFFVLTSVSWLGVVVLLLRAHHIDIIGLPVEATRVAEQPLLEPQNSASLLAADTADPTALFTRINADVVRALGSQAAAYVCYGIAWLVVVCVLIACMVWISKPAVVQVPMHSEE